MFDVFQVDDRTDVLFPAYMQAMNPRHPCYEFSSEMQWYFSRVFVSFLATVLQRFAVSVCQPLSARPGRPSIAQMQHRMPVARASAQAVGFKCSNCNGIFDSRIAVACHRRFPGSQGTACADPRSTQSLSFTVTGVLAWLLEFSASIQET